MRSPKVPSAAFPRQRLRWGRVLAAAAFPAAIAIRSLLIPSSDLLGNFIGPMLGAFTFAMALGAIGYGWNLIAKRKMLKSIEEQTSSGAEVFVVRKSRELAGHLSEVDEFAGAQIKQRFCNYAALTVEEDGMALWDCQSDATLLLFWDWADVSSVAPVLSETTFEFTRAMQITLANGLSFPLVLLDGAFLNLNRPLNDAAYDDLLHRLEAKTEGTSERSGERDDR
ncbi:hypothetical protein [Cryobacterium sp. PAMC25264]|uniref:hypothetical protein n=1 Tax=Cryobacterium sp. PAMC25264 TaxID=2861288 RepID=UPI001C62AB44|nr:hypothetical protein [Cryobacterium sp. PAMC25264]QYF73327.1 hypothetical protein KY500_16630 [Cryobacterium sp. PAMC25264]